MNTYDPLREFLSRQSAEEIVLAFAEIEKLTGEPLPDSAKKYDAFWANEDPSETRHYHCRAWRNAGYKAKADRARKIVTFRKDK